MDISSKEISVCNFTKQLNTRAEIEADIIVPDTKPDIYRVLSVSALADTTERGFKKDKMTFSGNVKFTILYSGEDDPCKIHSIDFNCAFNHQCDFPGVDEFCRCVCSSKVGETSFDIKNSRKIMVGTCVNFHVHANRNVSKSIVDKSNEIQNCPVRTAEYELDYPIVYKDVFFEVSETFNVPTKDENAKILNTFVNLDMSDIKAVSGKAVLKGQANVKILYESDDEISDYGTEVLFTEVLDIENLTPDTKMISHFEVCRICCDTNYSDMGMNVDATFGIRGYIIACEHMNFEAITDIYSPDYSYEKSCEDICITTFSEITSGQNTIKDSVEIPSLTDGISKIYHMETRICENVPTLEEASIKLSGNIYCTIIYSDLNGKLCRVFKTTPYDFQLPITKTSGEHYLISNVSCINSGYLMGSADDIQLRILLNAQSAMFSCLNRSVVTSFNADMKNPLKKESQPSITVVFSDSTSDIWEIAKIHNTTCEEIATVNSLDLSKPLPQDKPILIPKRQI